MKSVQYNWTFVFIELSKSAYSFVKIRLVLEIGNVIGFIKTRFFKKRDCIKMCKHTETFHKGNKLVTAVFISTLPFSKWKFAVHFLNVICTKTKPLHTPTFYTKMNHFNIVFHMTWDKWQRFRALRSGFPKWSVFRGFVFSQVQGSEFFCWYITYWISFCESIFSRVKMICKAERHNLGKIQSAKKDTLTRAFVYQ